MVKLLGVTPGVHHGWSGHNSLFFLILSFVASLSAIPLAFIRRYDPNAAEAMKPLLDQEAVYEDVEMVREGVSATPDNATTVRDDMSTAHEAIIENNPRPQRKHNKIVQDVINVVRCATSPRMLLLLCIFFNLGYQQVFVTSQFTRQILDLSTVGSVMGLYSVMDVVFSFLSGWLSDKYGHIFVVSIGVGFELFGIVVSWFANKEQNWLIYATGVIMAVSDAAYQTEVRRVVCWLEVVLVDD